MFYNSSCGGMISMENQFAWVDFYKEFAIKLLDYKEKRDILIEKVKDIYKMTGIRMPVLDKNNHIIDIDPFTVFGLFNKKLRDENRIKILNAVAKLFGVSSTVPTSFASLPVLTPQNATFYYFIDDREDSDIDDLWELFVSALEFTKSPTSSNKDRFFNYFDLVINKKGNGNSKITMGLYWISPDSFLNLDRRNQWYIYESGKVPEDIVNALPEVEPKISASKYFMISETISKYLKSNKSKLKNFKELSFEAWKYSEQVNNGDVLTDDAYEEDDIELDDIVEEEEIDYSDYTKEDFLSEVFMSEEDYDSLYAILRRKKNVVLQGAPGVGKTYTAKRLAYSIMGKEDAERVMLVQFHQSYSYEDFIMGFRPDDEGFKLRTGAFYNFCKKAESDIDNDYFFIIDEINRGNLSRIFGELFMLIEDDKRGTSLQLLYSDEQFAVPKNLYIIGMMNTADRSLAMLDYALRRRFAFFNIKPGFETDGFKKYKKGLKNKKLDNLIDCIESLNNDISLDESLGEGFCIGHSYFCNLTPGEVNDKDLYGIVEYEIIPLLQEYWFDEPSKINNWRGNLRSAMK